jgi:hypothetical protein
MSTILYIAPFFERSAIAESALAYVKALSSEYGIVCRPIGQIQNKHNQIDNYLKNDKCDYLVIHSKPSDFGFFGQFKKCVGITHLKTNLIGETNYYKYFDIMDFVGHDSSFGVPEVGNIQPVFDTSEYEPKKNSNIGYKFLIVGEPNCFEEIYQAINAYTEEFRLEENVDLTIKLPYYYNIAPFREIISNLISETRKHSNNFCPPIHFNNAWFPRKALLNYYNDFDCIINCSLYNRWSRPFIDCGFLQKRCISLLDGNDIKGKLSYGLSDSKEYPRGETKSFSTKEIQKMLRNAFNSQKEAVYDLSVFTLPQALSNFRKIFT